MKALVNEAVHYVYVTFVRDLKRKKRFDDANQQLAMDMSVQYVQDRIGADYSDYSIQVLSEQRMLFLKAQKHHEDQGNLGRGPRPSLRLMFTRTCFTHGQFDLQTTFVA